MSDSSTPPAPSIDWTALVVEMQTLAQDALGNRAKKINSVLGAADHSKGGVEAAIDLITKMRLAFVDPVRLADLADEMRARLAERTGRPLPAKQTEAPKFVDVYTDPGVLAAIGDSGGCLGPAFFSLVVGVVLVHVVAVG